MPTYFGGPTLGDYIARTFQIESGGDPFAVTGSNRGLGQFGPEEERRYGINDTNRSDPEAQRRALELERRDNLPRLEKALGRAPEPWEEYLTHQQGGAGGPALLSANSALPAWQVIRPYYSSDAMAKKAISGNVSGALRGVPPEMISVGDFTGFWKDKFGGVSDAFTPQVKQGMDTPSIMSLLQGQVQQQRPTGLMGAFSDPEAMAYMAMIAKGLSPGSSLDPQAMMQLAQRRQDSDLERLIRLQQLQDSQERLGFERDRVGLEKQRYNEGRADLERGRQADQQVYNTLAGGNATLEAIDRALANPDISKSTRDYLESQRKAFEERGKITRDTEERKKQALQLGLQEGSPAFQSYVLTGTMGKQEPLTATDRKAIHAAEDALPEAESTIATLSRAKELNDKTFSGVGAGLRGAIGAKVPGMGPLVGGTEAAKATNEWEKLMSAESVREMSQTLKGATTDFELRKFESMLADPSTDPATRGRIIDRMLALAQRQREIAKDRLEQLRGGTYYKPGGGQSGKPSEPAVDLKKKYGLE